MNPPSPRYARLPIFYGWIIVAAAFVTMAIGVNARTAFSLFFPPILAEFGWERGVTAGAFSFGFVASAIVSPLIGRLMDRAGPRAVMLAGVALMGGGLLLAPLTTQPWHLYLTIGVMVGSGRMTTCPPLRKRRGLWSTRSLRRWPDDYRSACRWAVK